MRENRETDGKNEAIAPACFGEITSNDRTDSITEGEVSALPSFTLSSMLYRRAKEGVDRLT